MSSNSSTSNSTGSEDGRLAPVSYLPWAGSETDTDAAVDEILPQRRVPGDDPERDLLEAENVLTRRLRGRSLSVSEARGVLVELELDGGAAEDLLERFERVGYLDDTRLAEQIVHTHHERKGLGRSAVEAEMRRRKLDQHAMSAVLDELSVDESGPAAELASGRLSRMSSLDDETAERRLLSFLMRKGYSSSVSREAVKTAFSAIGRRAR